MVKAKYHKLENFDQVIIAFIKLATLETVKKVTNIDSYCELFLTKDLIKANFEQAFQIASPGLARRFYYFLSDSFELERIYMADFAARVWCLVEGGFIQRNWFAFKMLDGDKDGFLGA